jgi:Fusaric acid resistance protein-like
LLYHAQAVALRWLSCDLIKLRRGGLFLINIGIPVLAGVARGEFRAALLGAIVGMVLSFADNEGALRSRLRLLLMAAGCMTAGALVGHALRDLPFVWPAFIVSTFVVGMAARGGREPLLAARNGAMAFAVAITIPTIEAYEIWYLAGALVLNGASRVADHLLFGPLPRPPAGPPPQMPSGHGGWFRFALAYAAAATSALWIGMRLDPTHTMWVVTTTLVVMQPDARASYRRIVERIAGTFAGVVAAWAITWMTHSAAPLVLGILVVAPLIPHHLTIRYWLHTALIALMILLAYDLVILDTGGIEDLLGERLRDMLHGCAIALVGTAVAFPHRWRPETEEPADDRSRGELLDD